MYPKWKEIFEKSHEESRSISISEKRVIKKTCRICNFCQKICYETYKKAQTAINNQRFRDDSRNCKTIYLCKYCSNWHLSSQVNATNAYKKEYNIRKKSRIAELRNNEMNRLDDFV
ncbi:MAG: hypothetical protein MJZ34_05110 [Paludibacteraceae bacterium]|nr:hypothetical protein [Paludibacteraceae bacterium]